MPDLAREVRQRAEDMERELHRRQDAEAAEMVHHLGEELRDVRREIERLRDQVAELRAELKESAK